MLADNYVYKKEVDWSLLMEGLTLPINNQVVFGNIMGHFLKRGESKEITLYLNGKSYKARITNVNFDPRFNRKKDTLQIRYPRDGELAKALQASFYSSFQYIKSIRENRDPSDRKMIKLPEDRKEYLAIYTTEYDDSYLLETIVSADIQVLKKKVEGKKEYLFETEFVYDQEDETAGLQEKLQLRKIRKLDRKIGENLKLLYGYHCQICGRLIGEKFDTHVAEAHHIDYFVLSLNNDANNQMILCPNHHSIIHEANPVFDRKRMLYVFPNGVHQSLTVNKHLHSI